MRYLIQTESFTKYAKTIKEAKSIVRKYVGGRIGYSVWVNEGDADGNVKHKLYCTTHKTADHNDAVIVKL